MLNRTILYCLMQLFKNSFRSFQGNLFIQFWKVTFHLNLLQNIGYIPCVEQYWPQFWKQRKTRRKEGGRGGRRKRKKEGRKGEFQGKRRMCVQNERVRREKRRVLGTPGSQRNSNSGSAESVCCGDRTGVSCPREERRGSKGTGKRRPEAGWQRSRLRADEELRVRADSMLVCLDIKGREMLSF